MRFIMELIGPELSELFALEFAKIAESDFVYTMIASTNLDQSDLGWVWLWVKSDGNIWSYLPLNKENLFNLTVFIL